MLNTNLFSLCATAHLQETLSAWGFGIFFFFSLKLIGFLFCITKDKWGRGGHLPPPLHCWGRLLLMAPWMLTWQFCHLWWFSRVFERFIVRLTQTKTHSKVMISIQESTRVGWIRSRRKSSVERLHLTKCGENIGDFPYLDSKHGRPRSGAPVLWCRTVRPSF